MNAGLDTTAQAARNRSNLYGFLAAVFRAEPTPALLRGIRETAFKRALEVAGVELDVDPAGETDDAFLDALAIEFTRLFIGPGVHVPPYAAVHLGDEWASLWGPDTVWVKDFIEAAGFAYRTGYHDLPDHVSVELEFMHELTAKEAAALEASDMTEAARLQAIESTFVNDHLARWIPAFCDRVAGHAERRFYRGLANLTKDFIEAERASLGNGAKQSTTERRKT